MSVIATSIEQHRLTRIFRDCRDAPPEPADLRRIEQAIEQSIALAQSAGDDLESRKRSHAAEQHTKEQTYGATGCNRIL
jgi:hypothetical protein